MIKTKERLIYSSEFVYLFFVLYLLYVLHLAGGEAFYFGFGWQDFFEIIVSKIGLPLLVFGVFCVKKDNRNNYFFRKILFWTTLVMIIESTLSPKLHSMMGKELIEEKNKIYLTMAADGVNCAKLGQPSYELIFSANANKNHVNYVGYPLFEGGEAIGHEERDCIVLDASNWSCSGIMSSKDGIIRINHKNACIFKKNALGKWLLIE